jgi:UPF0755 protein
MSYTNVPKDQAHADMPAVAPLDVATRSEGAQQQQTRRRIAPKSPRQALQPEAAPPPPPRSQKARHPVVVVLNFFLMVAVLAVLSTGAAFYFGKVWFTRPGPLAEPTSVMVARGTDLDTIAGQLQRQNVIDGQFVFTTAARIYDTHDKLKAGEYLFQPGVSMEQVLDDLVTGRSVLHAIVFPEGLTSQKIVERLQSDPVLTGEIGEVPPEGTLMPDTYKFTRGATRQQMIEQMQRAQSRAVEQAWSRRSADLPVKTPEEFVTLASIVERETGRADERPRVAAVFINRLRDGMRLQSDPTVIYGLFGGAGKPPERPIYQSELDKPTPYNTYVNAGLPPTPIANPGRAALEAVANPSRTQELYFVADGTGGHAFATTLDEHNQNVARWRAIEAVERRAAEAREAEAGDEDASPEVGADPEAADATEPSSEAQ